MRRFPSRGGELRLMNSISVGSFAAAWRMTVNKVCQKPRSNWCVRMRTVSGEFFTNGYTANLKQDASSGNPAMVL